MRSSARKLGLVALLVTVATAGCVSGEQQTPSPTRDAAAPVELRVPSDPLTVVSDQGADVQAVAVSSALFESSPVVALLADDAADARLAAASAAVTLGVPLLELDDDPELVNAEIARLGAQQVLAWGDAGTSVPDGLEIIQSGTSAESLSDALGVELEARAFDGDPLDAVISLERGGGTVLEPGTVPSPSASSAGEDGESHSSDPDADATLVEVTPGEAATGVVALLTDEEDTLAAAATVRAAGARAVALPVDNPDPERSPEAITALHEDQTVATLAVGTAFADVESLDWRVRSASSGWQLAGGGQQLFPDHMAVAIYGTPGAPVLGVLGEQDLGASIERARSFAEPYEALTDKTVLPAFEIITTVASGSAGSDGDYSNEIDPESLRPWIEEAGRQGVYVILDLQPGLSDFVSQAREYESLLRYPWVGLAVDPEWRLKPGERHLAVIGDVGADEVNALADYLAELVDSESLPPKLFVLHQFRNDMLPDRDRIVTDRPELTMLVHVDGQGTQPGKQATWRTLREGATIDYWGWKNFLDEDTPPLTPEQTMAEVAPQPDLITYQ